MSAALTEQLVAAVESFEPLPGEPPQEAAWRLMAGVDGAPPEYRERARSEWQRLRNERIAAGRALVTRMKRALR